MDSPFPPPIVTDRLILRVLDARDAPALLALYGDARVMHHWNHAPWQSMQQALAAIDEARRDYRQGASLHLAITLRAGGELIGSCALYDFTPAPRRALLGYLLAQRHWGHGYAGEALRGLLPRAFGQLGCEWIEAEVGTGNAASIRLLERLGFRHQHVVPGQWIVAGQPQDVALYALARPASARI